jgi:ubiquinone/menaquinone biosynthesis C-methylase UbiE
LYYIVLMKDSRPFDPRKRRSSASPRPVRASDASRPPRVDKPGYTRPGAAAARIGGPSTRPAYGTAGSYVRQNKPSARTFDRPFAKGSVNELAPDGKPYFTKPIKPHFTKPVPPVGEKPAFSRPSYGKAPFAKAPYKPVFTPSSKPFTKQARPLAERRTSWGKVARWYDDMLENDEDTYQAKVILPNVMRVLGLKAGDTVVELGSGQGYFAREFVKAGARVIGIELGEELVRIAKERSKKEGIATSALSYHIASADSAKVVADNTADVVVLILALQNMRELNAVMEEAARIMKPTGRIVIVMSHPSFRVPKLSHWGFDEEGQTQFRRVDQYLSDAELSIDMAPGKTAQEGKQTVSRTTRTYHRSLQTYMKAFAKVGLGIARLEEWISHRQSQKGPKQEAEDRARKEIPLFMCLELKKLG